MMAAAIRSHLFDRTVKSAIRGYGLHGVSVELDERDRRALVTSESAEGTVVAVLREHDLFEDMSRPGRPERMVERLFEAHGGEIA